MNKPQSTFLLPAVTATVSLREGMRLSAGGIDFVLWERNGSEIVLKRELEDEFMQTTEHELLTAIHECEVVCEELPGRKQILVQGLSVLRDSEVRRASRLAIEIAERKILWLNALHRLGVDRVVDEPWVRTIIKKLAQGELKDVKPFALSTLYAAQLTLAKADGDVTALVPNFSARGGAGASRMDPRAQAIALDTIRAVLARDGVLRSRPVAMEIKTQIDDHNTGQPSELIKVPCESTLTRFIKSHVRQIEVVKSNRGSRAASVEFRENANARDLATRPLEKSEWDDIDSAVFCVCEQTGLPWGRAFLTNGIDQFSKVILGFDLGGEPRSFESMIGAICHSLLPKPVEEDGTCWDGYGCQGAMLLDNARYNFCEASKKQSAAMRILLSGARPRGPTEKATIENYNGIVKADFCPTLPGWAGEKGDREALKEGACAAILPVQHLRRLYFEWVCKQYMNKPGVTGLTPRQTWRGHYQRFGPAIRYSADQLALFRLFPTDLKFRDSGGLLRLGIRYANDDLKELRRQLGSNASVRCYVDRRDMSYMLVENPLSRQVLRIASSEDPHYVRGLTEYQQSLIRAKARELGWNNPSQGEYVIARRALEEQVAKAQRSTSMRRRKWAQKATAYGTNSHLSPGGDRPEEDLPAAKAESKERIVTELESQMLDLEEVLLELTAEEAC